MFGKTAGVPLGGLAVTVVPNRVGQVWEWSDGNVWYAVLITKMPRLTKWDSTYSMHEGFNLVNGRLDMIAEKDNKSLELSRWRRIA